MTKSDATDTSAQLTFAVFLAREVQDIAQECLVETAAPPLPLLDVERLFCVRDVKREAEKLLPTTYDKLLDHDRITSLNTIVAGLHKEYLAHTTALAVRESFVSEYIDDTSVDALRDHITACWKMYSIDSVVNPSPLIALMQSAGFGKSRLLYELAKRVNEEDNDSISMRLLYVCPDNATDATAYPKMHARLREYLFPPVADPDRKGFTGWVAQHLVDELASRLVTIFKLANTSDTIWANVGEQWLRLFTSEDADVTLVERFKEANEPDTEDPPSIANRVLVLAIDEADWLWPHRAGSYVDWYWTFSRALVTANQRLRHQVGGASCGIFAVLSTVYSPPVKCLTAVAIEREDAVATGNAVGETKTLCVHRAIPFEPFILTDTMDLFHKKTFQDWRSNHEKLSSTECWSRFHQEMVLHQYRDAKFSMESLISMGRPLWKSCTLPHWMTSQNKSFDEFYRAVTVAAQKLLGDDKMPTTAELPDILMRGIASVLCRTGVQINSSSEEALQLVDRHMAVITTGSHKHVRHLNTLAHCSYPSDPMLAFGAAEVWYDGTKHSPNWLTSSILPKLFGMFEKRSLLVENMGILVAELVLLVVVDQCVASSVKFHHQFMDVTRFMSYLPPAVGSSGDEAMEKWRGWQLGFNHFVQLERMPTEGCLWAMLSRRAAGAFPLTQRGMDLFIPMLIDGPSPRVSMIIIQVHSGGSDDVTYASRKSFPEMRPYELFEPAPYVESLGPSEILRFVMRLDSRYEETNRTYYESGDTGYWQMNCAGPWKRASKDDQPNGDTEEVISQQLANKFINLLRLDGLPSAAASRLEALKDSQCQLHSASMKKFSSLIFGALDSKQSDDVRDKLTSGRKSKASAATQGSRLSCRETIYGRWFGLAPSCASFV